MNTTTNEGPRIRVSLGGDVWEGPEAGWKEAADALNAKHGGVPKIERVVPGAFVGAPGAASVIVPATVIEPAAAAEEPIPPTDPAPPGPPAVLNLEAALRASLDSPPSAGLAGIVRAMAEPSAQIVAPKPSGGLRLVVGGRRAPAAALNVRAGVSAEGKARSTADKEAAERAGFSPRESLYERGTPVNSTGVENARNKREEWERMPLVVAEAMPEFIGRIESEQRTDTIVRASLLRLGVDGLVEILAKSEDGGGLDRRIPITYSGFSGLVNRLGFGGAAYLGKCWPELRAHNVNAWQRLRALKEETAVATVDEVTGKTKEPPAPLELKLRERVVRASKEARPFWAGAASETEPAGDVPECFGVVSPAYAPFDCDKIAEAFRLAAPEDARGRVSYDGVRTRIEVLFHSTVQPEDFVAGEFFRAGVVITTDDTGGGGVRGSAVVWQNLCLNLIFIDKAKAASFNLRHLGSVKELADDFRKGFAGAMKAIEHFRAAWGFAVHEDVVERARKTEEESLPLKIEDVLPGLFNSIIERELVPLRGPRELVVGGLMRTWEKDSSAAAGPTRAAVVNAITRYAHEGVDLDPWEEDAIQRGAGALLFGRNGGRPPALTYLPLPERKTSR